MALGKRRDAPIITPLIKIDARNGKVSRRDREQDNDGNWTSKNVDIAAEDFAAIFDLENVQIGWMAFANGRPNFHLVKVGADIGDPPSDGHKEGFKVRLKLSNGAGNDVRELASTSKILWQSLSDLHDEYLDGCVKHRGKLPVVGIAEMARVQTPSGTYFRPIFEITGWTKRPDDLTP